MSENSEKDDKITRKSRKIGEKLRRERLNSLLAQLAEANPWSAYSEKRVDKAAILKLTASYLRFHHGLKKLKVAERKEAPYLDSLSILRTLQEVINGFLIIVSEKYNIVFVSSSITQCLKLHQVDVVGSKLHKFVHPEDLELFKKQLEEVSKNGEHTFNPSLVRLSGTKYNGLNSSYLQNRSFYVRMLTASEKNDTEPQYQMVHFNGQLKINHRNGHSDSAIDNRWLIAVGRPTTKCILNEIPTFYSKEDEFVSQIDLKGNIWFNDHRSALILCRLPSETVGASVYNNIYKEDIQAVSHAHKQIMISPMTSTVFRLNVRNKCRAQFILSKSIVARDSWTKEPKYIVSLNIALSEEEGKALLEEQTKELKKCLALEADKKDKPENDEETIVDNAVNTIEVGLKESCENLKITDKCQNVSHSSDVNQQSFGHDNQSSISLDNHSRKRTFSDIDNFASESSTSSSSCNESPLKKLLPSSEAEDSVFSEVLQEMDASKSYHSPGFPPFENEFLPNSGYECTSTNDIFSRIRYTPSNTLIGEYPNSRVNVPVSSYTNHHIQNVFHPYQRTILPNKSFQAKAKEELLPIHNSPFTLQPESSLPLTSQCNSPSMDVLGNSPFYQSESIGSSRKSLYSSNSSINSGFDRSMDALMSTSANENFGTDKIMNAPKNYNFPFYRDESMVSEPLLPNYSIASNDNQFVKPSLMSDTVSQTFGLMSFEGSSDINRASVIGRFMGNSSQESNLPFPTDRMYSSVLPSSTSRSYVYPDSQDSPSSMSTSPSCSVYKSKIQSPTVDSVMSPSDPKKAEEKDLQIQMKLSQQLHTKQTVIGNSLNKQREELNMLKTQLQDHNTGNGQCLTLLQRLDNLEKEVQQQDNTLSDLREQSKVKIQQLMS